MVSNQVEIKPQAQRSGIEGLIKAALERSARLDALEIEVTTNDGTAHLSGRVHSMLEKTAAARAAGSAPGIRHVDDRLVVVP